MESKDKKIRRVLKGEVVSCKMQNTAVVRVDTVKIHPRYKKRYTISKRYSCDFRGENIAAGTKVMIEECRPISKTKKWRIIETI